MLVLPLHCQTTGEMQDRERCPRLSQSVRWCVCKAYDFQNGNKCTGGPQVLPRQNTEALSSMKMIPVGGEVILSEERCDAACE